MKVIAIVEEGSNYGGDVYLVQVAASELAKIAHGQADGSGNRYTARVGTEIKVHEHWRRVRDIESAQGNLDATAKSLRAIADLLEATPVVVPPAPKPEPEYCAK